MSAPAPAPIPAPRRTVRIRLGGPAAAVAFLSSGFSLLLVLFPVSFPRLIAESWQNNLLTPSVLCLSALLNAAIYLRMVHLRGAKPDFVSSGWLGFLTALTAVGFNFLVQAAVLHAQLEFLPSTQTRIDEEILAQTYFGLVSSIFLPYLVLRFTQQLWKSDS